VYYRTSGNNNGNRIQQRWYAHRKYKNLMVHHIDCENPSVFKLDVNLGNVTRDFNITSRTIGNRQSWFMTTVESEGKDVPMVNVSLVFSFLNVTHPYGRHQRNVEGSILSMTLLVVGVTSLESKDPTATALDLINRFERMNDFQLQQEHSLEWKKLNSHGMELVGPNNELKKNLYTSMYYILSSIRDDWNFSLSPGSISTNTYNGHVFWDTETWMYPPLLTFYPSIARSILEYRLTRIHRAEEKARDLKYRGAMFPWESAFSGMETTPTWAETRDLEIHISGDIVFAIQQYFYITGSSREEKGHYYELISKVADFYVSRSTRRQRPSNSTQQMFDIDLIVPPDEYAINVNNSVFTNAMAQISMQVAHSLAIELGKTPNPIWDHLQGRYYFPFDASKQIFLEYEGYKGQQIKQADVILLGYPIQWKPVIDNPQIRKNDLIYYDPLTDPINGPAMSWGMYSIGWIEFNEMERAHDLFRRSYNNTHAPFYVWSEVPRGGGTNFITGAGGFIQNIVNGYGGMRIAKNSIEWHPKLMKGITEVKYKQLYYHGSVYSLEYSASKVTITLKSGRLGVKTQDRVVHLQVNFPHSFAPSKFEVISP
jgi:trehalose/maltose hydrolase-like predicted phosphorylase